MNSSLMHTQRMQNKHNNVEINNNNNNNKTKITKQINNRYKGPSDMKTTSKTRDEKIQKTYCNLSIRYSPANKKKIIKEIPKQFLVII